MVLTNWNWPCESSKMVTSPGFVRFSRYTFTNSARSSAVTSGAMPFRLSFMPLMAAWKPPEFLPALSISITVASSLYGDCCTPAASSSADTIAVPATDSGSAINADKKPANKRFAAFIVVFILSHPLCGITDEKCLLLCLCIPSLEYHYLIFLSIASIDRYFANIDILFAYFNIQIVRLHSLRWLGSTVPLALFCPHHIRFNCLSPASKYSYRV